MPDIDLDTMKQLIDLMTENDLSQLQYKHGDMEIELKRNAPLIAAAEAVAALPPVTPGVPAAERSSAAPPPPSDHEGLLPIKSPMVGTFYTSPDPDSSPYVKVGDQVTHDSTVCIIEAMKVFNEIKADVHGMIEKIMVQNAQAVEYGQVLFYVRAA